VAKRPRQGRAETADCRIIERVVTRPATDPIGAEQPTHCAIECGLALLADRRE